ncbi:MAG: hypothetical protein JW727_05445 [Candidatus Aenigmarchaeota archaeon]|nr:hypothetical protein [Candidatus Aenigmarchaeota archaeon]
MGLKQTKILGRPYPDEQMLVYEGPEVFQVGNLLYKELFAHGRIFSDVGKKRFIQRSLNYRELKKRTGLEESRLKAALVNLLEQNCVQLLDGRYIMNLGGASALEEYVAECEVQGVSLPLAKGGLR